jgi:hypothetical protein
MPLLVLSARTAITTRLEGALGHPAGGEAIHLITLGDTADEHTMGDLAQQRLLGFSVQGHGAISCLIRL